MTRRPRVAVVGNPTRATDELVEAWLAAGMDAAVVTPTLALATLEPGDVALLRLDVLPTLDGVEPGFDAAATLDERGVRVLNRPQALLAAHDKLLTTEALTAAGPAAAADDPRHPGAPPRAAPAAVRRQAAVRQLGYRRRCSAGRATSSTRLSSACRRGDGGRATAHSCRSSCRRRAGICACSSRAARSSAAPRGVAAAGEWRTNVSVGGHLERAEPPPEAIAEAERAARALAIDLAGVDLLPWDGGWVVLEVNGAIDFDERYVLPGRDMYREIAQALGLPLGPPRDPEETRRGGSREPVPRAARPRSAT